MTFFLRPSSASTQTAFLEVLSLILKVPDSLGTHLFRALVAFLTDWEKTNPLPSRMQAAMFKKVLNPLSATITTLLASSASLLLSFAFFTTGSIICMSVTFPAKSSKSSGIPTRSIRRPICTIASGRCSRAVFCQVFLRRRGWYRFSVPFSLGCKG